MKEEVVEADVLCVGGGIAGLMAAIRAGELGATVVVAEKGNARYSGCGRSGNDHFEAYIPEVHGSDIDEFIEELLKLSARIIFSLFGNMLDGFSHKFAVGLDICHA